MEISFRPLTDDDLPLLHRWLNEPGVVRWWEGDDVSWDGVVRDYGADRADGTEHFLSVVDGRNAGWIQCYEVGDWPEEAARWWAVGLEAPAGGIDHLIGEPTERGAGIGSAVIRAFVAEVCFGQHPHWRQVCADPLAANVASWRALEKAGFRRLGTVAAAPAAGEPGAGEPSDGEQGDSYLMAIDRRDADRPAERPGLR